MSNYSLSAIHPGVVERAACILEIVEANEDILAEVLLKIESEETVRDELYKTKDYLRNIGIHVNAFSGRVERVAAFLPLNLPLYSLALFGIAPALQSNRVYIRPPETLYPTIQSLANVLQLAKFVPEISLDCINKKAFCQDIVSLCDVVIFTGKQSNALEVCKYVKKNSLFLFNGRGVNPVVICENANLPLAVQKTADVKLFNSGQDCAAPGLHSGEKRNLETLHKYATCPVERYTVRPLQ